MFLYSTARELRMTVSQLLENTTSAELTEWAAFSRIVNDQDGGEVDVEKKLRDAFGANRT